MGKIAVVVLVLLVVVFGAFGLGQLSYEPDTITVIEDDPYIIIQQEYESVELMNASFATDGVIEGGYVLINTGNVEDEDNAKLYVKRANGYELVTDLSGAKGERGITGLKGEDGNIPYLRISDETGMWEVSYDNGLTWISLDTVAQGPQGEAGDDYMLTDQDLQAIAAMALAAQKGVLGGVVSMPDDTSSYWRIPVVVGDTLMYRPIATGVPSVGCVAGYNSNGCLVANDPVSDNNVSTKGWTKEEIAAALAEHTLSEADKQEIINAVLAALNNQGDDLVRYYYCVWNGDAESYEFVFAGNEPVGNYRYFFTCTSCGTVHMHSDDALYISACMDCGSDSFDVAQNPDWYE